MGQKMRAGLDGTVAGTGRKGAGKMCPQPECSVAVLWCRYLTTAPVTAQQPEAAAQAGNPCLVTAAAISLSTLTLP